MGLSDYYLVFVEIQGTFKCNGMILA